MFETFGRGELVGKFRAGTGDLEHAAQDRAIRVLETEGAVEIVVGPGQIEEVALGAAFRLVGELIEEGVESAEAVAKAPHRLFQRFGTPVGLTQHRTDFTRERPDPLADRFGRLAEQLLSSLEGGRRGLRLGDQLGQRRQRHLREFVRAGQPGLGGAQRRREFFERLFNRCLLVGEVAEPLVGGGDEGSDLLVVLAEFGGQFAEVMDHLGQLGAAAGDRLVQFRRVLNEWLEAAQRVAKLDAAAADPLGTSRDQ